MKELVAEFFGTFILMVFGLGSVAQAVLSGNPNVQTIQWAWGIAVTMGIYVAGGISGAHLNPAMTIALSVFREFPKKKVIPFVFAQVLGAFAASAVIYLVYLEAFNHFDGGIRQVIGVKATAGVFSTYPQPYLSILGGFFDQVVGTFILAFMIFSLTDEKLNKNAEKFVPLIVGLLVVGIGMSLGLNAGYAINPARDFGPRLFTYFFGWGDAVFTAGDHWWWVPITAPIVGALTAGFTYDKVLSR